MEQRCFNDFPLSMYRLPYKKLLSGMIEIRKPNAQQPLPREQGGNVSHKVRTQSISQERGTRLSSFVLKRMFTKGDPSLPHTLSSVPGSSVLFRLKRDRGLMRGSTQESSRQTFPGNSVFRKARVVLQSISFHFFSYLVSFTSFSALIAVASTSKTMLNRSGESGHPCLVPDFRGNTFNFSPLRIMFAVGLSYIAFIMLRYVPSIPAFWRVFIINGC